MSNLNWHSLASRSTNSASLIPNFEPITTTPPSFDADYISEQVHNIIFHKEEDRDIKWEFLTTKAPFPASKLVENKAIMELLLAVEPGPKVDYDGLRTNLALLQPYVTKTSSGPALLSFFKSLLQLQAGWLLGAAKLEAFRCYDRTLITYYVEWYEGFRKDTAARALDELEIAYEKECQKHAVARAAGSYIQQEQQLAKEVDNEAVKLVTCKTSPEMWKYSRILWAIVEQYQRYIQTKNALALQKKVREEEGKRRKVEEIPQRTEAKKKNAKNLKQQMGMQQQDANNLFMQQGWMADYAPGSG
jgi:hypothetical protein